MLLIVLFTFSLTCQAAISPAEALFICQYNGLDGFDVPCSDAANACMYTGIECDAVVNAPWNETIVSLVLRPILLPNTTNMLPTEIGNLLSLRSFDLYTRSPLYSTTIPTQIAACINLSSFLVLGTKLGGTLPSELLSLRSLTSLQLLGTALTGTIPSLPSGNSALRVFSVILNKFSGNFPSLTSATQLEYLDLSHNSFSGTLPDTTPLSLLQYFDVSDNDFTGNVPPFTSPFLQSVDLSHNLLDGTFPTSPIIAGGTLPLFYNANANELKGSIPSGFFGGAALVTLDLSYNQLSGSIPGEVILATSLEQLVVSHNKLSGTLSSAWEGAIFNAMFRLNLDHNELTGSVPSFGLLGQGRQSKDSDPFIYLNLNDNAFSGALPSFPSFPFSASLDFSTNALSLAVTSFGTAVNVSWLNLAYNPIKALPPTLFTEITTFDSLISLDLSHCQISGTLPDYFRVQYLELNNNYFTGIVKQNFVAQYDSSRLPVFADIRLNRLDTDATRKTSIGSVSVSIFDELVLTDFPQDVDECLLNTHACEYLCVDGWFPVPGYTCDCPSGFQLDPVNKLNCTAVCGDGLLRYPEEACDYEYSRVGCHHDCTVMNGYACDSNGCTPICGDGLVMPPEECDYNSSTNTGKGCTPQCTVEEGFSCFLETNTCQACAQDWIPFVYTPNLRLFPRLRSVIGDDLTDFNFASCISCDDGIALQTRTVLATPKCINMSTQRSLACSFACSNLTVFASATESIYTLQQELLKNGFLQHLFRVIFNANVTINVTSSTTIKRDDTNQMTEDLDFQISPCVSDKSAMINVIRALSLDIVPNLPNLALRESSSCGVTLSSTNPPPSAIFSIVLVISVTAATLLLVLVVSLIYYYRSSELHQLPWDIAWSFLDQRRRPWAWQYNGNAKSGYYSRQYDRKSDDYRKVDSLLSTHFKKGNVEIEQITAIYNPSLSISFVNMWRVMMTRKIQSYDLFYARDYTRNAEKMKVMEYVEKDLLHFTPYNNDLTLPLIPVLHGTDYTTAECIAQTGFAALSSLDAGFYGKGIYFTTSLSYTLIYACAKRRPAVILSYINMGNAYPVTERHDGPKSFKGAAIKSGYNSHVVRTSKRGFIYQDDDDVLCDEFVIPQESQILPAFLVELSIESCVKEHEKWTRVLPAPVVDGVIKTFQAEQANGNLYSPLDSIVSFDSDVLSSPHINIKEGFDI